MKDHAVEFQLVKENVLKNLSYDKKEAENTAVFDLCVLSILGKTKDNILVTKSKYIHPFSCLLQMRAMEPSFFSLYEEYLCSKKVFSKMSCSSVLHASLFSFFTHCNM